MRVPLFSSGSTKLPIREKEDFSQVTLTEDKSSFDLYPIHSQAGSSVLAKIQPPREPEQQIHHVPCDIVLVIDVSGSMGSNAPMPADENGNSESTGLSVLDLVKHAALTIIETMDERDRLGIVTFASSVDVVQKLKPMTEDGKKDARNNIKKMRPKDATNLWHGIVNGIKLFQQSDSNGKVPAVMVLTDGMPNHMCPHSGYVPKLRTMMPLPATIHTFGFGYSLRSGLLKSIAEIGNGNYAFIPDAGMIGTVFVHAVANLQSTYATEAKLTLTHGCSVQLEQAEGKNLLQKDHKPKNPFGKGMITSTIQLGNLQYGQSRDILLDAVKLDYSGSDASSKLDIEAELSFKVIDLASSTTKPVTITTRRNILDKSVLDPAEIAYHQSRSQICKFLSDLFPLNNQDEHISICKSHHDDERTKLRDHLRLLLLKDIPARGHDDALNKSIAADLDGPEPNGQICMAINQMDYWFRWGQHYLPSLWNAYSRQICNSFKDQGPLQFGSDSPLFISCRDRLDTTFDNLPPPEPSNTIHHFTHRGHGAVGARCAPVGGSSLSSFSMSSYRNASAGCFAASTMVELASGRSVEIKRLRRGFKIRTPMGSRKVAAVIKFPVQNISICRVGNVLVTPWHPISLDGKSWTFPAYAADSTARYTGAVYSIVLQRDRSPDAHAMRLDGVWGVTMGHGVTSGGDARAHSFFGDYVLVGKSFVRIGMDARGVAVSGGVQRDDRTGLVVGFEDGKVSQVSRVTRVAQTLRM